MKILILTSSRSPYAPLVLEPFLREYSGSVCGIATVDGSPNAAGGALKQFQKVWKIAGGRYALLKTLFYGMLRIQQFLGILISLESLTRRFSLKRVRLGSVRSKESVAAIKEVAPDVILSVLFERIIPPEIIQIGSLASLNFHPAPLPKYGGIAPTFWVLSNGEHQTAVTVHVLEEGIDTGDIVGQKAVPIQSTDTVHSLYLRCCAAGGKLLVNVFRNLEAGEFRRTPQQQSERTYYREPTVEGYANLLQNRFGLYRPGDLIAGQRPEEGGPR